MPVYSYQYRDRVRAISERVRQREPERDNRLRESYKLTKL